METTKIIEKAFCYFSPVGKGIIPFPVDTIRHFEINKDELMFSKLQEITDKVENPMSRLSRLLLYITLFCICNLINAIRL